MSDISLLWQFFILAILLLLSGFFSMSETSLMSINRYRLKHLVKQGHKGAKITSDLLAQTDKLLGVILLCNNLANASAATLVTIITVQLLGEGELGLMIGTISVTLAILIFSEISPKIIAAAYAEKVGIFCGYILYPIFKVLYPVVWVINSIVNGAFRLFGLRPNFQNESALSTEELQSIVSDHGHDMDQSNRSMVLNLFELEKVTVDDVMTAHTQVESINIDAPLESMMQLMAHTQHTRFPVRTEETEEIIGILHIRKLFHYLRETSKDQQVTSENFNKTILKALMIEPYFIPSGTPIFQQIQEFQKNKRRMALIVDEYGDIKGVVTLEDILEEIVGDFSTHSTMPENQFHQEKDGSWVVDASCTIRDINKKLAITLPIDGPKTLNGLIIEHFEAIPEANASFKLDAYMLEILHTQGKVVKSVRIVI